MQRAIFYNNKVEEANSIDLDLSSLSLNFGLGLFETILVKDGKAEFLDDHLARLVNSSKELGLPQFQLDKEALLKYFTLFGKGLWRAKLLYFENKGWQLIGFVQPYKRYNNELVQISISPVKKDISQWLYRHKTTNYLQNYLTFSAETYDQIFLSSTDLVLEGAKTNIFWIKNNVVFTPSKEHPILPGIMRAKVIDYCHANALEIFEGEYHLSELLKADEIFLTNSLIHILPVNVCEGREYGTKIAAELVEAIVSGIMYTARK